MDRELQERSSVLLATCQAQILDINGSHFTIQILLDPGSELSFITEKVVQKLRLTRKKASIPLIGIGALKSGRTRGVVEVILSAVNDKSIFCTLQAFILPCLTCKIPTFTVNLDSISSIKNLRLADPDFNRPGSIDMIIGSDSYSKIILPETIPATSSSPLAQLTIFGWVLSGPVPSGEASFNTASCHCAIDSDLDKLLLRFWTQEEVHCPKEFSLNPDEMFCEEHYRITHSRDSQGRYIVRLPLKKPVSSLGDSSKVALQSLARLSKRMHLKSLYRKRYNEFINKYENLGHMILVSQEELKSPEFYYLPHHGVLREQSRTTKLRVVFNASSPTDSGISLNDILYSGRKLQTEISDVLLWFRSHKYVFSTDMVKMYRQINVHPDDQNLQRIYWENQNQRILSYKLTTVTYGLNCSPFLALKTILQLVEDKGHQFPSAIPSLVKGRYVDDIFGGADSIEEAKLIIIQLIKLCGAGGFPLQKWSSNSQELISNLTEPNCQSASPVELEASQIKVLGMTWQSDIDTFQYVSYPKQSKTVTKRSILSEISQLFDPLGLIAPISIKAKILIQELWLLKVNWDDPLPFEIEKRWEMFREQLKALSSLNIPRWLNISKSSKSIEIHGFSDASNLAMAAVVYLRVVKETKEVGVSLVCAKTRVAPLKRMTIPRLELTAAQLLTRLVLQTLIALELSNIPIFLWTDSSVTLT